jgi:hypothetical protein
MMRKMAGPTETVRLCDRSARPSLLCECPWGQFHAVTLYVNGFPHKRIVRKDSQLLETQVREWLNAPHLEWRTPE